ncbi:MAG: 30S ribosomal protein S17 [Candidatus Pacearchaeota archaeon]|nr:30S ribosomal protein S17 [Candidatus Pacearchaeota archaeon]
MAKKQEKNIEKAVECEEQCWLHGSLKVRGRFFKGYVIKKFPRRVAISFERTVFIQKYERYMKKRTKLHARLPKCMQDQVQVGDYIEIGECRPLSKIIHFVVTKVVRKANVKPGDKK